MASLSLPPTQRLIATPRGRCGYGSHCSSGQLGRVILTCFGTLIFGFGVIVAASCETSQTLLQERGDGWDPNLVPGNEVDPLGRSACKLSPATERRAFHLGGKR